MVSPISCKLERVLNSFDFDKFTASSKFSANGVHSVHPVDACWDDMVLLMFPDFFVDTPLGSNKQVGR